MLILYVHALHSHCILTMFHAFRCGFDSCWMCAGRFGLGFYLWYILNIACHMFMHTYFLFLSFLVIWLWCSLSLSLSLSLTDRLRMAPKALKSTPSQNPLQGYASSSSDLIPPPCIQFCDEKARKDFLKNFQKHGAHSKRHVILSDFSDTPFPVVIRTWGWESLLESPLRCPIMFI